MSPKLLLLWPLLLAFGVCGCALSRPEEEPVEVWDLSAGREIERVNWGGAGWEVVDNEQFKGPITLTVYLPLDRKIEGTFSMARVLREDQRVDHVSLTMAPCSAAEAYSRAKSFLKGLHATAASHERLDRWYGGGPESGPGEQLIVNLLESSDPSILGVDIDWVWASSPDRNWIVTVAFFWDRPAPDGGKS